MKRLMLIAIAAFTALAMCAADQKPQKSAKLSKEERQAKMLNARVKTMKEKLLLTTEQTEQFIPLYQEYLNEMGKQFGKNREKKAEVRTIDDAQAQVLDDLNGKAKVIEIQKKFVPRFAKILTPQQLVKFLPVESEMQRQVRREHHKRFKGFKDSVKIKRPVAHGQRRAAAPLN
ncbi:MAG: hypothetical protein ACI4UN_06360 [Muribaculaceae bacterium]